MFLKYLALAAGVALTSGTAIADCQIDGNVSIVGNDFPAIHTVAKGAAQCSGGEVKSNLTADHQKINVAGMQANPAEYSTAIIANSSLVSLMNEDVVRPLNELVAEYGQDIPKNQLITIDGKIMAVAFMANAQTLVYRKDVLEEVGAEVPATYEDMLDVAEKIRAANISDYPLGGSYAAGWDLAEEFINMYYGFGGEFFAPGSAEVSINNEQGVSALNMMKELTQYMNPDFLTHDSNAASAEMEAGNVMLMNMWGSRMGALMDEEGAEEQVYSNIATSGPLTVGGGSTPASTLWWDGWTVAKNISDEDAVATFIAMKNGTSTSILNEETMGEAVWMIQGYQPAAANEGVFEAIAAGTQSYPMLPYMGLLHTALGDNIADFLLDKESAEQALIDTEAAYTAAANEKGFL